jgi:putative ABC transport system substrate-binding protein
MAGGLLAAPLAAEGQQAKKVWRIGYLTGGSAEREKSWLASFRQGLRELGYVERESIVIEQRYAEGRTERLPELTKELIQLKVDVLVAAGDSAALAAKKATSSVPVVFVTVADPVGLGIVVSLARPGGNVTGLSDLHADIVTKRLELLKEIVPSASRRPLESRQPCARPPIERRPGRGPCAGPDRPRPGGQRT